MQAALLQFTSTDDPAENAARVAAQIAQAASDGAKFVLTPEVTNGIIQGRGRREERLRTEAEDQTLVTLRAAAADAGVWLLIGSLALKTTDAGGRLANRSFMVRPDGEIAARYDKIHMFDAAPSASETYRESAAYRPGEQAVIVQTPFGKIGMTICYDLRFPHLFRTLAQAGADIITVPSAFSPTTGAAHWEPLLRARAIECGAFVLAPAQTGQHPGTGDPPRASYGHSLAVGPWGEILLDAGTETTVGMIDIDLAKVHEARRRVASLGHDRDYAGP